MAAENRPDRSVQFVAKLVQLTQERKIRWNAVSSPEDSPSNSAAFESSIDGKQIRVRKVQREVRIDAMATILGSIGGSSGPRTRTAVFVILEILDDFGRVTYNFERTSGLADLYEGAAFSASNVDDLMDSVLRKT